MHAGAGLAGPGNAGLARGRLRLLALAGLASLALHVLVLYALPILEQAIKAPARRLSAHLAKPQPPAAPAREEPIAPPRVAPRPATSAKAMTQASTPRPVPEAPVLNSKPSKQPAESVSLVPAAPTEPVPAAAGPQVSVARTDLAPAAGASGPDPGSVARFRLELMDVARRYKRYPRIARDNNWEGRVELRIEFAENGSLATLSVKKSAGRAVLDDAAQAMIRSAQAQAAIPPALHGKAFALEIAVDYFLRDEAR